MEKKRNFGKQTAHKATLHIGGETYSIKIIIVMGIDMMRVRISAQDNETNHYVVRKEIHVFPEHDREDIILKIKNIWQKLIQKLEKHAAEKRALKKHRNAIEHLVSEEFGLEEVCTEAEEILDNDLDNDDDDDDDWIY